MNIAQPNGFSIGKLDDLLLAAREILKLDARDDIRDEHWQLFDALRAAIEAVEGQA